MSIKRHLLVLGSAVLPLQAHAIIPIFSGLKSALDLVGVVGNATGDVAQTTSDISDLLQSVDELSEEIGVTGSGDKTDLATEALSQKTNEVINTYQEAGYTREETADILSVITSDERSLAGKLRSLKRTIRSIKSTSKSILTLLKRDKSDDLKKQDVLLNSNKLHMDILANQLQISAQLDEHLRIAREEKSYRDLIKDHLTKTLKRLKNEELEESLGKRKLPKVDQDIKLKIAWTALYLLIVIAGFAIGSIVFVGVGLSLLKICFVAALLLGIMSGQNILIVIKKLAGL